MLPTPRCGPHTVGQNGEVRVWLLGPFEVRTGDGVPVEVSGARLRALLAALALEPGRVVGRARLVDWIWGEEPPADAVNAVQALVSRLRRVLPDGSIEAESGGYRLAVTPDAVDVSRFESLVARARTAEDPARAELLREALGLWRGTALQDIALPGSEPFDAAATRLNELHLAALGDRVDADIRLGRGADLISELTELTAAYPLREGFVAALMRAFAEAGRGAEALVAYQRMRERLDEELGVEPSAELSALHTALLRGEIGGRAESRRTNLRAELTSFIGEDDTIAAVSDLLTEHRLVTLTGPGGSGKTRLATETARTMLGELPDGTWLVELAPVRAGGDVAQAALTAIGLRDQALLGGGSAADPVDRLVAALRDRMALLILDNCEHVIEAAATFAARLLGECRRLRILATSREPLGITGEVLWQVEPLVLPRVGADSAEVGASPAVRLLRDRARAVRRDIADDEPAISAMARICRALDGMPLAIELAAARLRTMSIDQLADRLDDRFRLLNSGSRTALPRHRTLRAVVDWSWDLLSEAERAVLRRLSVFTGGASLEAAERICADETFGSDQVLELLTALVEKSLILADGGGAPRYRMLDTIREYAAHRLTEAGEAEQVGRAHLIYFTELVERADPHLRRAGQLEWLATLEADHANIAAALRRAIAEGRAAAAMRLVAAAGWYWLLSGRKAEGTELGIAAASLPGEVPDAVRAMAYFFVGLLVTAGYGAPEQAEKWIHEAHRLAERTDGGHPLLSFIAPFEVILREPMEFAAAYEPLLTNDDPWQRAQGRLHRGRFRLRLGLDEAEGEADIELALAEFRALGERWGISLALISLADHLALHGEFARACEYYDEAIAALAEVGATEDAVGALARQAQLYWLLGDETRSRSAMAEAQRCAEQIVWPDALIILALVQAELARWRGEPDEAYEQIAVVRAISGDAENISVDARINDLNGYLAQDLEQARAYRTKAFRGAVQDGYQPLIAQVLVGIADLALRQGRYEQAAQLLAASDSVRGMPDRAQPDVARIADDARNRLGDIAFAEATRVGGQADWRELAELTLAS